MYGVPQDVEWSFLVDRELEQVCIGLYDLILNFHNGVSISVTSSCTTRIAGSAAAWSAGATQGAEGVLLLLRRKATSVSTTDRSLTLKFEGGDSWTAYDNDERYESFTVTSPNGLIVV
ncbi:MAG TPA: hypothetical protein VGN57_15300 [Pirellulaceae bacterium]|jgi:hypothetical protein|nr:hypothetical protein [Pirellulaceae bacterium]